MTRNIIRYDNMTRNIMTRYDNNMTRNYTTFSIKKEKILRIFSPKLLVFDFRTSNKILNSNVYNSKQTNNAYSGISY